MEIRGLIDREYVHTVIRKRPRDVHKGECGKILIIAGSRGMAGAAVFASKAAIKCGSGLVKICTNRKIFPVLQLSVPEAICMEWGNTKDDLMQYDCIAVGPGMGVDRRSKNILKMILKHFDKTVVIDADGLTAAAKDQRLQQLIRETKASVIMTPHIGEAKRLLGNADIAGMKRIEIASFLRMKYGCMIIVKGADTLVAVSDKDAYTNTTGNPGMATAGAGDVLTGIIASLAGQGLAPEDAAKAGVFVHGLSGDLAADKLGEYGLTASDIADYVPFALKELTE